MAGEVKLYRMRTFILVLILMHISMSTSSASKTSSRMKKRKISSSLIKNKKSKRKLLPGFKKKKSNPHPRHSHDNPNNCLKYTCDELSQLWMFPGDMPDCPGLDCLDGSSGGGGGSSNGGGGSSNGGGGSSNGGGGSSNGGGGSSNGGGGGNNDDNGNGGGGGGNNDDNGNGGGGGNNNDDGNGGGGGNNDDGGNGGGGGNNKYYNYNDDQVDPNFDLTDCSTYSDYWMWDLNFSCQNNTDYNSCECTTAAMMLESGDIQCPDGSDDIPYCPSGCSVCDTCLTLLGCAETRPENPFRTQYSMNILWYALAGALGIILGIIAMTVHKKKSQPKPMEEYLIEDDPSSDIEDHVWLAPVS